MVSTGPITWCQQQQPQTTSGPLPCCGFGEGHIENETQPLTAHVFSGLFREASQRQLRWT